MMWCRIKVVNHIRLTGDRRSVFVLQGFEVESRIPSSIQTWDTKMQLCQKPGTVDQKVD